MSMEASISFYLILSFLIHLYTYLGNIDIKKDAFLESGKGLKRREKQNKTEFQFVGSAPENYTVSSLEWDSISIPISRSLTIFTYHSILDHVGLLLSLLSLSNWSFFTFLLEHSHSVMVK